MDNKIQNRSIEKETYNVDVDSEKEQNWFDMSQDIDFSKPPELLQQIPNVILEVKRDKYGSNFQDSRKCNSAKSCTDLYIDQDVLDIDMPSYEDSQKKSPPKLNVSFMSVVKLIASKYD